MLKAIVVTLKKKTKTKPHISGQMKNLERSAERDKGNNFSDGQFAVKNSKSRLPTPLLYIAIMLDIYLPSLGT